MKKIFQSESPLILENGKQLENLSIAYHTYGEYKDESTKVIWVCHALTANSNVADWWANIFGKGKVLDDEKYFIVCANVIGSCYGSSSPTDSIYNEENPFPLITVRDMVTAHILLRQHLSIDKIHLLIGGSLGGQQAMEWAIVERDRIKNLVLLATNAKHSAWGIAFNETQRMALALGNGGLEVARAVAMLSYRNYEMYSRINPKDGNENDFPASTYQRYQGKKLAERFDATSYKILSLAMDGHNVGRGRESILAALKMIVAKVLVIGINTDNLFPIEEQFFLQNEINNAQLQIIVSPFGHDGFLTEGAKINDIVLAFLEDRLR